LWVQQEVDNQYVVSPLAKALGPANLCEETRREINLALGRNVLRRKHLNQSDGSNAITYFCGAQAWDMAGHVLLTALLAMMESGIPEYDAGLLGIWSEPEMPLPSAMNIGLRLMLRAQQIALRAKAGRSVAFLVTTLDEIASSAPDSEAPAVFAASLHAGNTLASIDVDASCRNIVRGLELLPRLNQRNEFADILDAIPIAPIVWVAAMRLSEPEHLTAWLRVLAAVPPAIRTELPASEDADISCMAIADAVWLAEAKKAAGEQAWPRILASLEHLAETAKKLGVDLLWACAVRSQIIVLAEYEGEFEKAIHLAQGALGIVTDPRGRFVLLDCIATQFMYKKKNSEASKCFAQAAAIRTDDYRLLRLRSLMHASVALEPDEFPQAQEYLEAALAIGRANDRIPVTECVKAIGEMCVLRGLANDLPGAYAALDEAASRLLAAKEDTPEWKGLFMVLGHVSGYFTTISCTKKPPEKTIGGEPYGAPVRGMFLGYSEAGYAGSYDEAKAGQYTFNWRSLPMPSLSRSERDTGLLLEWRSPALGVQQWQSTLSAFR
jgi:tetratricopeptide (TPR) repeat protein